MAGKRSEALAFAVTVLSVGFATAWPFAHEARLERQDVPPDARVITLTGVAASGTWTEAEVDGGNYWWRTFAPARPVLRVGEPVVFRLKSADVVHTFYAPELGLGPVEVYPGNVAKAVVVPKRAGVFRYYCTTFCGNPHFGMRGEIVVGGNAPPAPAAPSRGAGSYWLAPAPPANARLVDRGRWLFQERGCVACHGQDAKGGVPNFNYVAGSVPALNALAERMMLFEPDDARAIIGALERGVALDALQTAPPVPRFAATLAQYHSIRDKIRDGSPSAKLNPEGPDPPLQMPAWKGRLSDREIDALVAYLLTLQPAAE
jgi:mono/diheme cytochrome c family protein